MTSYRVNHKPFLHNLFKKKLYTFSENLCRNSIFYYWFIDDNNMIVYRAFPVVSFGHRSVFPLLFDGTALEKWWKSALVFKVFAREKGQQSVSK